MPFNTKPIGFAYDDMRLNGSALVNVPTTGADVGIGIGGGVNAAAAVEYSGTFPTDANNTLLSLVSGAIPSGTTGTARMYASQPTTTAASFTLTSLQHFWAAQGTFGAGSTVTTQVGFLANSSLTGATNNYGFQGSIAAGTGRYNFYASGSADNYFAGSVGIGATPSAGVKTRVGGTLPTSSSNTFALEIDGTVPSGTTSSARVFRSTVGTEATAFTLSSLSHFTVTQGTFGAGSAVTTQYGFLVQSGMTGATNNYGFFSDLAAASNRYNFYANGTADNYMAGSLGLGTTPGASTKLQAAGTYPADSGLSRVFVANGTVSSGATTAFRGFDSSPSTAAASFTCTELQHYYASQGSLGAGSAVTNQFGFIVENNLTGATNNYGFYSQIPSGTGRWNFYAAGTANNYFAGNVGIGRAPNYQLDVYRSGTTNTTVAAANDNIVNILQVSGNTAGVVGTITSHPLIFTAANTERMRITSAGNIVAGASAALATTATDGFLYVPTCAGTPTGTPTAITGMAPIVVNTTNNKLYFYSGGAWRDAGP